ncbi:MAG: hypothetical protein ACRD0A_11835 [Acidimicrobiales bacterium]
MIQALARRRAILILTMVLVVPLVIALVAQLDPTWVPVLDWAQTELRVRDVGSAHTPLVGLPGRIGTFAEPGSHPGPLSFYALAPVYRLLGSSAWAMQAGTVALNALAVAAALWIARRRGGVGLVVGLGALLAVVMTGYGGRVLTEPWNPFLPVLVWVVFLLAVWSVLAEDLPLLSVAVATGSVCAQTHVSYVALVGGLGVVAGVAAVLHLRAMPSGRVRSLGLRWLLISLGLGVVLWLPPVIDQLVNQPGNLRVLLDHFGSPPEAAIGLVDGVGALLPRFDPLLLARQVVDPGGLGPAFAGGSSWLGAGFLVLWGLAFVAAARLGHERMVRLDAVLGAALVLGTITAARIFGTVWYYLLLWVWGLMVLMFLAIGWTAAVVVTRRVAPTDRPRVERAGAVGLLAVAMLAVTVFAVDAPETRQADAALSAVLADLVPPTAEALEAGVGPADGRDGRYVVAYTDAVAIGSQSYGLVSELERLGFDVGVRPAFGVLATRHRVLDPAEATARVVLATGVFVVRWREVPGAVEVALVDRRTPAEREEFDRLRTEVIAELGAAGLAERVVDVDENLFGVGVDPRVPATTRLKINRLAELGVPTAVFVAPPDADI